MASSTDGFVSPLRAGGSTASLGRLGGRSGFPRSLEVNKDRSSPQEAVCPKEGELQASGDPLSSQ